MAKLISFEEAIRTGLIKEGDMVNLIACLQHDNREVLLEADETGWDEDQVFEREDNLKWCFTLDFEGNPILLGHTTEFNLALQGEVAYKSVKNGLLNEIASVYSNEEIGIYARSINIIDADFLENNENICFWKNITDSWINTSYSRVSVQYFQSGIKVLKYFEVRDCDLYDMYGKSYYGVNGITPIILLKDSKILLQIDLMERDGEWKLIPAI